MQTIELNYLASGSLDDPNWAPIVSLNGTYTELPAYAQVLHDYARQNFLPDFLTETEFELDVLLAVIEHLLEVNHQHRLLFGRTRAPSVFSGFISAPPAPTGSAAGIPASREAGRGSGGTRMARFTALNS